MKALRVILLLFLLPGCQTSEILPKRTGQEYVPFRVGQYWEYAVTETTISEVEGQMNTFSELRVEVIDSVVLSNSTIYVLQRKTRNQGATTWVLAETWSVDIDRFRMVQQEEMFRL